MDNQALPCFLDFEASSLRDSSHSIEVAWSLEDGVVEAYLIKPAWDWSDWDYRIQEKEFLKTSERASGGFLSLQ